MSRAAVPVDNAPRRTSSSRSDSPSTYGIENHGTPALVTTRFEVVFDRYLDARSAIRQAVCIRSDTAPVEGFDTCTGGIFLRPQYDPARRVITYFQESDSVRLAADTVYTVTVLAPRDGGDLGVRAFDGASLEASQSFLLRTADVAPEIPTDAPVALDAAACAAWR